MMHHDTRQFGFWVYLMTDCVLFAGLFAVYAVFHASTAGGVGTEIFSAPYILIETLLLLTSSFTAGLALVASRGRRTHEALVFFAITAVLGVSFVGMEVFEFVKLIAQGNGPQASGFLSGYFALVGTHGLHIIVGLVWMLSLMVAIALQGLTSAHMRKVELFTMFWHFLDVIWIFIFTIVYLFGLL
jgi:cytochrome o ubiquinol oxidase subunit 3